MLRHLALVICALLVATPALAQSSGEIVVAGRGEIERPSEWARIAMTLRGEGKTSVDALRALTDSQKKLEDSLHRLADAKSVKIITGDLKILPVQADDCEGEEYRPKPKLEQGGCAIQGYVATMTLIAKVAPADRAGDAASLAAELGARNVTLVDFGVEAPDTLREAATRAAVDDARKQALTMANASGRKLGAITKIQSGMGFQDEDQLEVTADAAAARYELAKPAAAPTVRVDVTVPPVTESARVIVAFRLEP